MSFYQKPVKSIDNETLDLLMDMGFTPSYVASCSEQDFQKLSPDRQIRKIENFRNGLSYRCCCNLWDLPSFLFLDFDEELPYSELVAEYFDTDFSTLSPHNDTEHVGSLLSRICNENYFPNTVGAFQLNNRTAAKKGPCFIIKHTVRAVEKLLEKHEKKRETLERKEDLEGPQSQDFFRGVGLEKPLMISAFTFVDNYISAYLDQLEPSQFNKAERAKCYSELETFDSLLIRLRSCWRGFSKPLWMYFSPENTLTRSYLGAFAAGNVFLEPVLDYMRARLELDISEDYFTPLVYDPKFEAIELQNEQYLANLKSLKLTTALKLRTHHNVDIIGERGEVAAKAMRQDTLFSYFLERTSQM